MNYPVLGKFLLGAAVVLGMAAAARAQEESPKAPEAAAVPALESKDFSALVGTPGFSGMLLNNHFKLYQGYVKNTNALLEKLGALRAAGQDRGPEYAELKRRLGWEYNGLLLHEYYFENLGGNEALDPESALAKKIAEDFGSFEEWKNDFISTGLMRGIGWVVLYLEPRAGRLVNSWVNEHDTGNLAGARPLLVMDVFEHAFMTDYQLDKAKYIEAFFKSVDWKKAAQRFAQ